MMLSLRESSIRRKQMLIIMLTSTVSLLLACAGFIAYDVARFRREMVSSMSSLAEVVGNNMKAAIEFDEPESAELTLTALRGERSIVLAHLYTPDGREFATYLRDGAVRPPEIPHSIDSRHDFTSTHLYLFHPIMQGGQLIATFELVSDLNALRERLWRYGGIAGLVLAISLLVAYGLSNRLQKVVSDPILDLARMARSVALDQNYALRATKTSSDELGALVDGFNEMLGQIQQRDAALHASRNELEARVIDRTSELGRTNQALQNEVGERERAQSFLNSVVEHLPIAVFIKEAKDLRFVHWNKAGEKLTGIPNAEMIGKTDFDMFPVKDAERNVAKDRAALEIKGVLEIPDEAIQTRDHGIRIVRVWKVPIFDPAGEPAFLLGIAEDITDRRRAEESLRLQATALNATANVVVITDTQGLIVWTNPAFTNATGYTAAEALGQNPRILKAKDRPSSYSVRFYQDLWQTISSGTVWHGEFHNTRKDGSVLMEDATITPVRDAQGKISHFVAVKQDITDRKRTEAELANTHRQLIEASRRSGMAEIATNVLHNVGNVLNSVNISSDLIAERVKKFRVPSLTRVVALLDEHTADLGNFITGDVRGKHLPAHLAQLSRHLEADQKSILGELDSLRRNIEHINEIVALQQKYATFGGLKEMVNLVHLAEDSLRMNEGALSQHRVEVIREYAGVPLMNVEKHKVLQILVNLVRNAKQACEDSDRADKRLTMRVAKNDGRVLISVMDNGVGIPPENMIRIFNFGFTTRKGGHGFGLHSGALAAREIGGVLTAHSDGPGRGAVFTLELPSPDTGDLA